MGVAFFPSHMMVDHHWGHNGIQLSKPLDIDALGAGTGAIHMKAWDSESIHIERNTFGIERDILLSKKTPVHISHCLNIAFHLLPCH